MGTFTSWRPIKSQNLNVIAIKKNKSNIKMCQSDQLMVWIECAEAVIHVLNNNFFLGYDSLPRYYRSSQCAKNTKKKNAIGNERGEKYCKRCVYLIMQNDDKDAQITNTNNPVNLIWSKRLSACSQYVCMHSFDAWQQRKNCS